MVLSLRRTEVEKVMNQTAGCMQKETLNRLAARSARFATAAILLGLIGCGVISAQTQKQRYDTESMALKSQAEQAAERQVALSPEKIIELLRQEPGLLLQVKKMLVRKAYEQGRILDPEDLTDDALFQLLHEDHKICVLATREIEDREYVKAKPSREEIDRQRELDAQIGVARVAANPAQRPADANIQKSASQEDSYWQKHDGDQAYPIAPERPQPNQRMPETPSPRTGPLLENPQRQLE